MTEAAATLTHLGPYRLIETLGSGAMGTVYLAQDEEEDRRVALKVLHPHLLERKGFFKRFQREALAGERVKHPNVVRTLDCGLQMVGETPYSLLVMEYVEGRTLRTLLHELETVPEALLREIAHQVTSGLIAIHEAGIVHRDLKPENVLITSDDEIRIMDLGVARLTEVSTELTKEGQFAGSLLYAAPEQFRGEKVGPAADLYALGVMLYELAVGSNPFRYDHAAAVVTAHLDAVPPKLDRRIEDVSPFLAEIVSVLLAKGPAERFTSAAHLKEVLEKAQRSDWWIQRERRILRERSHLPRIPVRRETRVYGRETELQVLRQSWQRAKDSGGNTLLLEGEAGIGKTRLLDIFVNDLAEQDVQVLYGSYAPSGGMGGISDAVLGHFGAAGLEDALQPYLAVTPALVPAFAGVIKREAPPESAATLEGDALHAVFVQLMRAVAKEKPLVWVVEDLHNAETDSRKLLLSLARAVEGHRILLLMTARPGIPEEELVPFSRLENLRRMGLGRLSARDVILLLQDAFRSEMLADKLGARIALKSDGVPFFVFEMIRGLEEGQFITQLPDGSYVESKVVDRIEVPSAVKDLIDARLRGLSDEERAILNIGAVEGYEFDPFLVASVRDTKRVSVLERLASVERRTGVVRAQGRKYRFDHHQIQEVVYSDLLETLKEEYHSLLAEGYAVQQSASREGALSGEADYFLAFHHLNGSRPDQGLPHLERALDHLEHSYRNDAAIDLSAAALLVPWLLQGKERVDVLLRKAAGHDMRGENRIERALLDEALQLADATLDPTLRAQVRLGLGNLLTRLSDWDSARGQIEHALGLARDGEDKKLEIRLERGLGNVARRQGFLDEADQRYRRCLALAREMGDVDGEAAATINMGIVLRTQGHHDAALEHFERGMSLAQTCGNRRWEAVAIGGLGDTHLWLRRFEDARPFVERGLAMAREIGDRQGECIFMGNLGSALARLESADDARTLLERSVCLARELGDRHVEASLKQALGGALVDRGLIEEGGVHIKESCNLAREIGDWVTEAFAFHKLGECSYRGGHLADALRNYEKSLGVARDHGLRHLETHLATALPGVLACVGKMAEAEVGLEHALAVAREDTNPEAAALAATNFGALCLQLRRYEAARAAFERGLSLARDIGDLYGQAVATANLGHMYADLGRSDEARAHFDEALQLSREVHCPDVAHLATVHRACLPGGNVQAAVAALAEHEDSVSFLERMEARFHVWQVTADKTHLAKARRLLCYARDHAPKDCRESMIENVPLHRDIMKAWEEQQEPR